MKKLLMFAAAAVALTAPAAFAEDAAKKGPKPGFAGKAEKLDTDGDGFISKQEFLSVHEKRFADMDLNSDGKIGKNELEARREKWKQKRLERKQQQEEMKTQEAPAEAPADDETPE